MLAAGAEAVTNEMLDELRAGLTLSDGTSLRPMQATVSAAGVRRCWVEMRLGEGKKREIRRVWSHYGFCVSRLIREGYGPFELGDLSPGEVAEVGTDTVRTLMRALREGEGANGIGRSREGKRQTTKCVWLEP